MRAAPEGEVGFENKNLLMLGTIAREPNAGEALAASSACTGSRSKREAFPEKRRLLRLNSGKTLLVEAVQQLSLARDLPGIMAVVRRMARRLTGADGATFVLREGDYCFYADEEAIAPLWKGQRFPLSACISGWAMLNRRTAVIEDIYADSRIPADAYRPTFVKSLVMVPIRTEAPLGAIGNYWAARRQPAPEEVELLEALANTTAVAMENVRLYGELETRVKERTAQLEAANRELEAFSYAVSHDLGAPLRSIRSFAELLTLDGADALPPQSKTLLQQIQTSAVRMRQLMDDLLRLSKITSGELNRTTVNLSDVAGAILNHLASESPARAAEFHVAPDLQAQADPGLMRVALENLLSNSWKYTAKCQQTSIEFGREPDGTKAFFVRDNGAGFDMKYAAQLFQPFRRLHPQQDYPGTGIGLATVQRIVQRHGGRIWAEAAPGQGAVFFFTLG